LLLLMIGRPRSGRGAVSSSLLLGVAFAAWGENRNLLGALRSHEGEDRVRHIRFEVPRAEIGGELRLTLVEAIRDDDALRQRIAVACDPELHVAGVAAKGDVIGG